MKTGTVTVLETPIVEQIIAIDEQADDFIVWGAGRAAAITLLPIPILNTGALMANEAYMIYNIAETYGYKIDDAMVTMLIGMVGGNFSRRFLCSLIPILSVPIAAGITYAMGKVAKAYFASGMTLSAKALKREFSHARRKADKIDWSSHNIINEQEVYSS